MATVRPERRRTHKAISDFERQAIRERHRQGRSLTQKQLALWATAKFNRHISQTTISDCLHAKYASLDLPIITKVRVEPSLQLIPLSGPRQPLCEGCHREKCSCGPATEEERFVSQSEAKPVRGAELIHLPANEATVTRSTFSLPKPVDNSAVWFPRLLDAISTSVPAHRISSSYTQVDMLSTWFSYLPSVLGKSKLLDTALRGFSLYHIGVTLDDKRVVQRGCLTYGRALYELKTLVAAKDAVYTREDVIATMILSLFELCTNGGDDGWMKHALGAAEMLASMDPASFEDDMGLLFIRTFGRIWNLHSFTKWDLRFVKSPQYRQAILEHPMGRGHMCEFSSFLAPRAASLHSAIMDLITEMESAKSPADMAACGKKVVGILVESRTYYDELMEMAPPIYAGSKDEDKLFPDVYRYLDVCHASAHLTYRAGIISIMCFVRLLQPKMFEPGAPFAKEVEMHIDGICKSVDYVIESGFLGAATLIQVLSVILTSISDEKMAWIRRRLGAAKMCAAQQLPWALVQ